MNSTKWHRSLVVALAAVCLGACAPHHVNSKTLENFGPGDDATPQRASNSDRAFNSLDAAKDKRAGTPAHTTAAQRPVPGTTEPKRASVAPPGKCGQQTDAQCFVEQAEGPDKDSAVRAAKAAVISQIRSKVTASSEQESTAVDESGGKSTERVEVHIHYAVNSKFSNAELIKFKARQDEDSGAWIAVAWLERQAAAKVLTERAASAKAAFDQAIVDVETAAPTRNGMQSVARAYAEAWTNFATLRQAFYEIQVLLDDQDSRKTELDTLHASMAKAEHQVLRLRDSVKFELALATDGAFTSVAENHLRSLIMSAAGGLDVNTGQHPGATSGFILKITAECPCRLGSVGPICELKVGMALHKEAGGEAIRLASLDALEYGTFGQTEKATVEACVIQLIEKHKKNSQRDVKDAVRKVVGAIVPLAPEVVQED